MKLSEVTRLQFPAIWIETASAIWIAAEIHPEREASSSIAQWKADAIRIAPDSAQDGSRIRIAPDSVQNGSRIRIAPDSVQNCSWIRIAREMIQTGSWSRLEKERTRIQTE